MANGCCELFDSRAGNHIGNRITELNVNSSTVSDPGPVVPSMKMVPFVLVVSERRRIAATTLRLLLQSIQGHPTSVRSARA
jgi:hypothetical protein